MRKLVAIAAVAMAGAGLFATSAQAAGDCGAIVVGEGVYVAHDANGSVNAWLYAESNGTAGLQRGGTTLLLAEADSCQEGAANPDTAIF